MYSFRQLYHCLATVSIIGITFSYNTLNAQDFLGFSQIVSGPTPAPSSTPEQSVKPYLLEANTQGGVFEVSVNHKVGASEFCRATYLFEWKFSAPVDRLYKDQPIDITYTVSLLSSPCKAGGGKMVVQAASGASNEFKALGIRNAGGITLQPTKWLQVGENAPKQTSVTRINAYNPMVDIGTFKINFESTGYVGSERLHYEVVYVFEHNYSSQVGCDPDINCHNLYSVGVLVGFAEYGAFKNDDPLFLAQEIDGAIEHAKASNCVPIDMLMKLSQRLKSAAASKPLHSDLTALRHGLAKYVESECNCCN